MLGFLGVIAIIQGIVLIVLALGQMQGERITRDGKEAKPFVNISISIVFIIVGCLLIG